MDPGLWSGGFVSRSKGFGWVTVLEGSVGKRQVGKGDRIEGCVEMILKEARLWLVSKYV